jgi:hypothetical protein
MAIALRCSARIVLRGAACLTSARVTRSRIPLATAGTDRPSSLSRPPDHRTLTGSERRPSRCVVRTTRT